MNSGHLPFPQFDAARFNHIKRRVKILTLLNADDLFFKDGVKVSALNSEFGSVSRTGSRQLLFT